MSEAKNPCKLGSLYGAQGNLIGMSEFGMFGKHDRVYEHFGISAGADSRSAGLWPCRVRDSF